jgi:hypothetical protein
VPEYHQHECGWGLFAGKEAGQQQQDWEDDHVYGYALHARNITWGLSMSNIETKQVNYLHLSQETRISFTNI